VIAAGFDDDAQRGFFDVDDLDSLDDLFDEVLSEITATYDVWRLEADSHRVVREGDDSHVETTP